MTFLYVHGVCDTHTHQIYFENEKLWIVGSGFRLFLFCRAERKEEDYLFSKYFEVASPLIKYLNKKL